VLLGTKYLILEVLKCRDCGLIFVWPREEPAESDTYYQKEYASPLVTELPNPTELAMLVESGFDKPGLDFSRKIETLKTLRTSGKILDFGCSWGYGTYQLKLAGFDPIGFEISKQRARFGREKLQLRILDDIDVLRSLENEPFDIIFSNHVLEHLPNLRQTLDLFAHLLAKGGVMFHVLPNLAGDAGTGDRLWRGLHRAHPIAPTREFFERNLPMHGFRVTTGGTALQGGGNQSCLCDRNSNASIRNETEFLVVATRI
jgi:SAM-dependent methyltransferase